MRTFPVAATQYLADCMKPSIRMKLNQFILHVVAIDLNSTAPSDEIAKTPTELVSELKKTLILVSHQL